MSTADDYYLSMGYPGPGLQFRVSFLPNGRTVTVIEPDGSGTTGGGFGGLPASIDAVAGLKRQKHGDDDDPVSSKRQTKRRRRRGTGTGNDTAADEKSAAAAACAICLDDFEAGDGVAVMPCEHRFHERCLDEWLALSRLCPCCRHALPASDDDGEGDGKAGPAASTAIAAEGGGGRRRRRQIQRERRTILR